MQLRKVDIIIAFLISEAVVWLGLLIAKNLDFSIPYFWALPFVIPLLAVLGLYISFLIGKRFLMIFQAAKFLLVGGLNTMIDLGVLNFLILISGITAGFGYSAFKGLSFLMAVTNSYFWNKLWTFRAVKLDAEVSAGKAFGGAQFSQFFIISVVGFFINVGIASFVVNVVGPIGTISEKLWANIGGVSAIAIQMTWNFLGYKFIVFKK